MPDHLGLDADTFGLACWRGRAAPMVRAHRHDDIEVNVVETGRLDYLFGGRRVSIPAGTTSVFWAALPHQLLTTASESTAAWLTVPLDVVLRWQLPATVVAELLGGAPLLAPAAEPPPEPPPDPAHALSGESLTEPSADQSPERSPEQSAERPSGRSATAEGMEVDPVGRFVRWARDLADPDPALTGIALLEMQAYLHRVLRAARPSTATAPAAGRTGGTALDRATAMATFVALHFREPLSVEEVSAHVHLTPHYAMQVFRDVVGTTLGTYLTQCRVAEAQRLLISGTLKVDAVAYAAGFGSPNRLYAAFSALGLPAPARYRRSQRQATGGPRTLGR